MIAIRLPKTIEDCTNQIKALETVIPYDNVKDKAVHETALKRLLEHREYLIISFLK